MGLRLGLGLWIGASTGPGGPALNAGTFAWDDSTINEGDDPEATYTADTGDGGVISDVKIRRAGVVIASMVDEGGGVWTYTRANATYADNASWDAQKITDLGNKASPAAALTVTPITATLVAGDSTPDEGDTVHLTGDVSYGTVESVTLYESGVEIDSDTAGPWDFSVIARPGQRTYTLVVVCTESGAREIGATANPVLDTTPEAPDLDAPTDESTIDDDDTSEPLTASGDNAAFDANTDKIEFFREPNGGGTPTLLATDSSSSGGWTGTWDPEPLAESTEIEVYALRYYTDELGQHTIPSARADVVIVASGGGPADFIVVDGSDFIVVDGSDFIEVT